MQRFTSKVIKLKQNDSLHLEQQTELVFDVYTGLRLICKDDFPFKNICIRNTV